MIAPCRLADGQDREIAKERPVRFRAGPCAPVRGWHIAVALLLLGSCARPRLEPEPTADGGGVVGDVWLCEAGQERCRANRHQTCVPEGEFLRTEEEDCAALGQVCVEGLWCVECEPGAVRCSEDESAIETCRAGGSGWDAAPCDVANGEVCWDGLCVDACERATQARSNVGCEYWAVDLDNASITINFDASAQQFGVVVSNPGQTLAHVAVEIDRARPGEPPVVEVVDEADVFPGDLEVFDDLPRREVDGTPDGAFDYQGLTPHSHLSAAAFRITSDRPVIAYQFNPMDNAGVFSNDASLLLPTAALDGRYVVMGWPQTIADTDDPATDKNDHLRSFLTVVGTAERTHVSLTLSTDTVEGDNVSAALAGDTLDVVLGPFEVLNLETGGFNADFTGTLIDADRNVVVYSGSEASDVPFFDTIPERQCCADHLEEQLTPVRTLGRAFFATPMPRRTAAVLAAGATVAVVEEPEYFRILAVDPGITTVRVTLPGYEDRPISLEQYQHVTLRATRDFSLVSDRRVSLGQFVSSQDVVGIPQRLPGGDPAFVNVPPSEQFRKRYVFLTPDLYAFDFVVVVAPRGTQIELDGAPLPATCETDAADGLLHEDDDPPAWVVHRCQLSFPELLPPADGVGSLWQVLPGLQDDGVHTLEASQPVGLLLYGFDRYVSYALAGGTDLTVLE